MFNRSLIAPVSTAPLRVELCDGLGLRLGRLIRLHRYLFQSRMLGRLPQHPLSNQVVTLLVSRSEVDQLRVFSLWPEHDRISKQVIHH